mmetsp:Transcript_79417/g.140153  ORF Transcript_79417/g.140153 Transcript_79417/m.140153 type:complete len:87 (+) Transcript_79417:837-1097(+)
MSQKYTNVPKVYCLTFPTGTLTEHLRQTVPSSLSTPENVNPGQENRWQTPFVWQVASNLLVTVWNTGRYWVPGLHLFPGRDSIVGM